MINRICYHIGEFDKMENEIIIALIEAGTTILTIIGSIVGSIIAVKLTGKSQIKEQKIAADREMKRQYYKAFVEALTKKMFYENKPECIEKVEAEIAFQLESNKLVLYASEEVVQFMEGIKDPAKECNLGEILLLLRKDLCDSSFERFVNIKEIKFTMPIRVICTDFTGKKHIF